MLSVTLRPSHVRHGGSRRRSSCAARLAVALCIWLLVHTTGVFAQDPAPATATLRGLIVEARTGVPLPAVLVQVESTRQRAVSDAEGRFTIDRVPLGTQTLVVSVVGFGLVRRELTMPPEGVDLTVPIAGGASTYVEEVAVTAGRFREAHPGAASQSLLGSRELLALRGVIADDPFRAVQVLPGVAASDDFRAEFAVRGLGPSHIGLSIDEVDSPLLFHTVRGVEDTGSLALINSEILEEATLLSGAHPQQLGSHLGARLDFRTRDGARDRVHARALVSGSAATAVAEGPLGSGRRGSWLVAGRKSYIDWLLRRVDTALDGTFGFADAQGKLTLNPTPSQTLQLSVIAGQSELDEDDDLSGTAFDRARTSTVIGNVQWRLATSPRISLTQQLYLVESRYRNRVVDGRTRQEGRDRDVTWRGGATWAPAAGHLFELGAQVQALDATRVDHRLTPMQNDMIFDVKVDAPQQAGWLSYRWTPTPDVVLAPGVRVEHWTAQDQTAASPWLLGEWQLAAATRLRGGLGVQRQAPTLDDQLFALSTLPLSAERALVVDLGVEQRVGGDWRAALTAYHREERDRLRYVNAEPRVVGNRVRIPLNESYVANTMSGTATGIELTLERRALSGFTGWLSYGWGRAQNTDSGRRAGLPAPPETFAADWDQRHTVNANVGYRWSARSMLALRYRYGSNFPIHGYVAPTGTGTFALTASRNTTRLPDYSRLDLRADRTFTYRRSRLTLFAEIVNALNQDNYRARTIPRPNSTTGEVPRVTEKLFPLLPSAGILIEF